MFKDLTTRARAALGSGAVVLALLASMVAALSGLSTASTLQRQTASRSATTAATATVADATAADAGAFDKALADARQRVIGTVTQQNAGLVQHAASAAASLAGQAGELQKVVGEFRLDPEDVAA